MASSPKVKRPGDNNSYMYKPFMIIVSVVTLILGLHTARAAYDTPKAALGELINTALTNMTSVRFYYMFQFNKMDWSSAYLVLIIGLLAVMLIMADKIKNANRHAGKEEGTAKWNDWQEYNKIHVNTEDPDKNIILGKNTMLNSVIHSFLNNHIIIVGGSGTGKTRGFILPNILQMNNSFIMTDPSGEGASSLGKPLIKHGYRVKIFNLNEMQYSCGYNPFRYIKNDEGVMKLIDCIIKNTNDKGSKGDAFFDKAEKALLLAIFYYIYYFCKPEEQNMRQVMIMLNEAEVSEDARNEIKSPLDKRFDEVKKIDPNHVALRSYRIFKQGTGKTAKSILISAQVRLAPFNIKAVNDLTMEDTIHLEEIGDSKQALFIITPTGDTTYNFLAAMMYTQLFQILTYRANTENPSSWVLVKNNTCALRSSMFTTLKQREEQKKKLEELREKYMKYELTSVEVGNEDEKHTVWQLKDGKTVIREFQGEEEANAFVDVIKNGEITVWKRTVIKPVCFYLDEFANIGQIPDFNEYLATVRKYLISICIVLQSISQIKEMYKENYATILTNCSTNIFLGGQAQDDFDYFSKLIGETTQTVMDTSDGSGKSLLGGSNHSYKQSKFALMKPDQLRTMPLDESIIIIQGTDPFYDKKFPLESHKRYSELGTSPATSFDIHPYFKITTSSQHFVFTTTESAMKDDLAERERTPGTSANNIATERNARTNTPAPNKYPESVEEAIDDAAQRKGLDPVSERLMNGIGHLPDILTPITKQPFPPKMADTSAVTTIEVIDYNEDGEAEMF